MLPVATGMVSEAMVSPCFSATATPPMPLRQASRTIATPLRACVSRRSKAAVLPPRRVSPERMRVASVRCSTSGSAARMLKPAAETAIGRRPPVASRTATRLLPWITCTKLT